MQQAIEIFAALNFLVIGLSHVFQHEAWAEFFARLHREGRPGAFASGFLSLATGSLIVAFHGGWEGPGAVLTAVGWAMVLKAAVVFVRPDWGLASLARIQGRSSRLFVLPGVLLVALAAVLGYSAWG